MFITRTGEIAKGFYSVGHPSVPVYLLDGADPVLFDAGFSGLAFAYEKDIRNILGPRSPSYLFLTHSHWDHIGSAAHFKKCWPEMKIAGASRIRDVLGHPAAIKRITSLSEEALKSLSSWGVTHINRAPFRSFPLDMPLAPTKPVKLSGGIEIHPLLTPGHTWDSCSYWIPSRRILIAGEAVICDGICEFLVDYDRYQDSLRELSTLDVDILCTGHHMVVTGKDARKYILDSMIQTAEYLRLVERLAEEEHGNLEKIVTRIKAIEWDNRPLPKQPERAYVMNTRIRVKKILERSRGKCPVRNAG
ncbi:MAG: hypothetical protein DRG82_13105 [Deltaproteobacteria bacterium]|nr:MAG: hypothetical protein DRG82_13105 [Deltaproteobacteria bacterium]